MDETRVIRGEFASRRVWINDRELLPERSQRLRNHSPDGFNWGYGGSGPAQLALALMLEFCATPEEAQSRYQEFKSDVIAKLPQANFDLCVSTIQEWIDRKREIVDDEFPHQDAWR